MILSVILLFSVSLYLKGQYNADVIKAAYIEHITRFVEWPQIQNKRDTTNFNIGVYGDTEFLEILREVLKNKTIKGKNIRIIKVDNPLRIILYDLCYLSGIGDNLVNEIMSIANNNSVLIMTEGKDLGEKGIHINFYVESSKLKFEINRSSMDSGKFKVSSLLLKNSKII